MGNQLNIDFTKRAKIETETEYRNVRFRIVDAGPMRWELIRQHAGTHRKVWNVLLDEILGEMREYAKALEAGADKDDLPKLNTSRFDMMRRADGLKRREEYAWMAEMSSLAIRGAAQALSDALNRWFSDRKKQSPEERAQNKGRPRFKGRRGNDWFRYNDGSVLGVGDGKMRLPKIGWVPIRRKGGNPYAGLPVKSVTIRQIEKKWFATLCYAVTVPKIYDDEIETCIGMDAGVAKQVTLSNGEHIENPDLKKLERKLKRHQRRAAQQQGGSTWKRKNGHKHTAKIPASNRRKKTFQTMARISRKIANIRDTHAHRVSRKLADSADLIVVEDLNLKDMTKRAKERNVKAKSGLNRVMLNSALGGLKQKIEYKAKRVIPINPAYTSQCCNECGHINKENRKSQAQFKCKACGHTANADVNAAKNILIRGLDEFKKSMASVAGATGRRGAFGQQDDPKDPSTAFDPHIKPTTHRVLLF